MKKILLATSAIVLSLSSAYASDGTITITGQITDRTCTVDSKSKDLAVVLPTVSAVSLASGQTAGRTPFTISLTNCSEGKVATYFEPGSTVDYDSGRLNNATGTATNVQVQLLGDNNQVIPVLAKTAGTQANSQEVNVAAGGSAALNYYAEYYAKAQATAGSVATSVKYTIVYP